MNERDAIARGWFYAPGPDGRLVRRPHGWPGRIQVRATPGVSVACQLRAASTVGRWMEESGIDGVVRLTLDETGRVPGDPPIEPLPPVTYAERPTPRVLFFESLMNTDMPHNDREISQGVLHMASSLRGLDTEVVLANVKMPIVGDDRPVLGLDDLKRALAGPPVGLVCITLLEGYWEGVVQLIRTLRELGCHAHIAVGGVMPSLSPEHVAAHLPEVSFVCRGAGEAFLPALVRILGDTDARSPWTDAQRDGLLGLDGLLAIDRVGRVLLSANSARTVVADDLDAVPLDLTHLLARHIEGGIEIATSRGCIHRCTFCTILGRESYQARSAEGVFDLLSRYEARFHELYGDDVPPNAYRLHLSDDDFACDRPRAAAFFAHLRETPFRLSSVQVSIADLCVRRDGVLLPELDPIWDVLVPELFADHGRPIPDEDFVLDHRSRTWSSFLQIGVETLSDRELVRLGKGYRLEHVRAVVDALARREIHMDAYFIVSNTETTAGDLTDSVEELCRLKMRYPRFFHLRFPVVPHLVSYFPSATHKRKVRSGRADTMALRAHLRADGVPELDYPLVDHDIPDDPRVARAVEAGFLTDRARYVVSLERLRELWQDEPLRRRLDDARRVLVFEQLSEARKLARETPGHPAETAALATAEELLGPSPSWLGAFRRWDSEEVPRLVVIPTWQCELRCRYCWIPKQDGRVMSVATLDRSLDLLLSSRRPRLMLQFFGGEALTQWDLVRHAITRGLERAAELGKDLSFVLSSNGWSLDEEKIAFLADKPVKLELSLDGDPETQNQFRRALEKGRDSYESGIPPRAQAIVASGLLYDVIMVVHPQNVDRMPANFFHIASLGFRRIQINFTLGLAWSTAQQERFASGLHEIGDRLKRGWAEGGPLLLVNLENSPMPMRLNGEVTVDWDGTIYGGNAFLHETEHKARFVRGHLDDHDNFDRYWLDGPDNGFLLEWSYPPDVTANNLAVGRVFTSFLRWLHPQVPPPLRPAALQT